VNAEPRSRRGRESGSGLAAMQRKDPRGSYRTRLSMKSGAGDFASVASDDRRRFRGSEASAR
jgi:hypothetical protein